MQVTKLHANLAPSTKQNSDIAQFRKLCRESMELSMFKVTTSIGHTTHLSASCGTR